MHRNLLAALTLALSLAPLPALADSAQSHAAAAKKAERRGDWQKALGEWTAAYGMEINADYLIGIGDAYARLGNKDEARKQYDAFLSDPLASPANLEKVKGKIAALDAATMPGLDLPGLPPNNAIASAAPLPGLPGLTDLPPAPEPVQRKRRGKKERELAAATPAMPGLDLPMPGATPANGLALPDLPPAVVADNGNGKKNRKDAAALLPMLGLDLALLPPPGTVAPAQPAAPGRNPQQVAASASSGKQGTAAAKPAATASAQSRVRPASTATSASPDRKAVPDSVIAETPSRPLPQGSSSSTGKVVAFVAAGVAVAALGGGFLAYSAANSADKDLTGSVHNSATATSLLESEKRNKSLAFVGLSAGLLSAGIATALFTF